MPLQSIDADCKKHESMMDSAHERMDRVGSDGGSGKGNPDQGSPYSLRAPRTGGPSVKVVVAAIAIVLAMILVAVLVIIIAGEVKSPEDVYREYVDASNDQDIKRMYDQTVLRFASNYQQRLDVLNAFVFVLDPKTEIVSLAVTYQSEMSPNQKTMAQMTVEAVEASLPIQVDDFCYVDYAIHVDYMALSQSDDRSSSALAVLVDGHWYLAMPETY